MGRIGPALIKSPTDLLSKKSMIYLLCQSDQRVITASIERSRHPNELAVGSTLSRTYRGEQISVTVVKGGFEYNGERYRSLTAIAKAISGSHCSGPAWFGLRDRRRSN